MEACLTVPVDELPLYVDELLITDSIFHSKQQDCNFWVCLSWKVRQAAPQRNRICRVGGGGKEIIIENLFFKSELIGR